MLTSRMCQAMREELEAIKEANGAVEVAGLGLLAAPAVDNMVAKFRARRAGANAKDDHAVDKFRVIKERFHDPVELGGLGVLAAPYIHHRLTKGTWG